MRKKSWEIYFTFLWLLRSFEHLRVTCVNFKTDWCIPDQFSSDASHHLDLVQTSQGKDTVPNKTALISDASHWLRGLHFWPTGYKCGGSSYCPLGLDNLTEWLTGLRKVLYRISQMKRHTVWGLGGS